MKVLKFICNFGPTFIIGMVCIHAGYSPTRTVAVVFAAQLMTAMQYVLSYEKTSKAALKVRDMLGIPPGGY